MEEMPTLRLVNHDDVDAVLAIFAPYVTGTAVSFEVEVPSREAFRHKVQALSSRYPYVVCTVDGRLVGFAYASEERPHAAYRWNAEVSVYLELDYHRRGIATQIYRALFDLLAMQGFRNVYAVIALPNPGSLALHQRLGFTSAGVHRRTGFKLGRWRDVEWLHKALVDAEDGASPPEPPLAIGQLDPATVADVLSAATARLRQSWTERARRTEAPA